MIEKSVVFPAPFGPISAVICPACAASEAAFTASKPPNLQVMPCTARSGSATAHLLGRNDRRSTPRQQLAQMCEPADQPARHDPDDQHEHGAINNEIKSGSITRHELCTLAQGFDHERPKQRTKHCPNAANDRGQQCFD